MKVERSMIVVWNGRNLVYVEEEKECASNGSRESHSLHLITRSPDLLSWKSTMRA